jgi:hypothetical protein
MQLLMLGVIFSICGFFLAFLIRKITHKYERETKKINFELLLNACFDDEFHAMKLVEKEKLLDSNISDEEAAALALENLLSEHRTLHGSNHSSSIPT